MLARATEPMPPAASLASNSLRAKGPRGAPRRPRSRAPYLWGSGEEVSYTNLPAPITDEAPLNPDHTHFIFVDSGKKTTWCGLARPRRASPDLPLTSGPSVARGTELRLRAEFEAEYAKMLHIPVRASPLPPAPLTLRPAPPDTPTWAARRRLAHR